MRSRIPEITFYEWSITRWLTSTTRGLLDALGRGIFRELLDMANAQGSIPNNLPILANYCGCSLPELESRWPILKKHFQAHKSDPEMLVNRFAEINRKQYFLYIKQQKTRSKTVSAKKAMDKPNGDNALGAGGFSQKERKEKERKEKEVKEKKSAGATDEPENPNPEEPTPDATGKTPTVREAIDAFRVVVKTTEPEPIDRLREMWESTGKPLNEIDWAAAVAEIVSQDLSAETLWREVIPCLETALVTEFAQRETFMIPFPVRWFQKKPWTRKSKPPSAAKFEPPPGGYFIATPEQIEEQRRINPRQLPPIPEMLARDAAKATQEAQKSGVPN